MNQQTLAIFDGYDNRTTASATSFRYKSLPGNTRHGTHHAYNLGCRCRQCRLSSRQRQKAVRDKIWDYKIGMACVDCGVVCGYGPQMIHPVALDLDHRPGTIKLYHPAKLGKLSKAKRDVELAKCDPRCANCHRVATFERQQIDRKTMLGEWVD